MKDLTMRELQVLHQLSQVEAWSMEDFSPREKRELAGLVSAGLAHHDRLFNVDIYSITPAGLEALTRNGAQEEN